MKYVTAQEVRESQEELIKQKVKQLDVAFENIIDSILVPGIAKLRRLLDKGGSNGV